MINWPAKITAKLRVLYPYYIFCNGVSFIYGDTDYIWHRVGLGLIWSFIMHVLKAFFNDIQWKSKQLCFVDKCHWQKAIMTFEYKI